MSNVKVQMTNECQSSNVKNILRWIGEAGASHRKGDLPSPKRSRLRDARASAGIGRSSRQAKVAPTQGLKSLCLEVGAWDLLFIIVLRFFDLKFEI